MLFISEEQQREWNENKEKQEKELKDELKKQGVDTEGMQFGDRYGKMPSK